jgi:hypothetical protein
VNLTHGFAPAPPPLSFNPQNCQAPPSLGYNYGIYGSITDLSKHPPTDAQKAPRSAVFFEKLKGAAKPKAFNIHHPSHFALTIRVNAGKDVKLRINT